MTWFSVATSLGEDEDGMVWRLDSGEEVTNRPNTHLAEDVRKVLPEALARVRSEGRKFIEEEVEFGHVVGNTICVTTTDKDQIVWAQRPGRRGQSRFVVGRKPEPTTKLMVVLKWAADLDRYLLITAFFGAKAEPEPWDRHATSSSKAFWDTHALVWGSTPVVPEAGSKAPS